MRTWAWVPVVLVWGVVAAWWTPRGPLTGLEAAGSVVVSALAGFAAKRPFWAPAAFVLALEAARIGVRGPSVDLPHPSAFGFVALLSGRGVHGFFTVLPMLLGAVYGAGFARRGLVARDAGRRIGPMLRRAGTGVLSAVVVVVTVVAVIPARTAGTGPGGIAELALLDAGPHRLGVMIRGRDRTAPVLLFVPGAPGGTEFGAMRHRLAALEDRFVVATLERRGAGSSYAALDPTSTVTVSSAVGDTLAVTDHLRARFKQDKIVLVGHSGGSLISVLAVQRAPGKFRAYVGVGQAVDVGASDRIFYDDILAWARREGRTDLAKQLTSQGPPPYRSVYAYEPIMTYAPAAYGVQGPSFDLGITEHTLLQKAHTITAVLDTWDAYYPSALRTDLRRDAARLDVPVFFVQGGREMRGLAVLFAEWYATLEAPKKDLTTFETSGHRPMFEEPGRFAELLDRVVQLTG